MGQAGGHVSPHVGRLSPCGTDAAVLRAAMGKSLRVLWLSHFLPYPPKGGALQRSHHLLRQMAGRHEVHLVALSQRAILRSHEDIAAAVDALNPLVASLRWFPIPTDGSRGRWAALVAATFFRGDPYDATWLSSRAMDSHVRRLSGHDFDLVHVDTLGLWPYRREMDAIPTALNHHNIESHLMGRRAEAEPNILKRLYFAREAAKLRRWERAICPRAAMNLTVSALDAERLRSSVVDAAVRVVPNGVDTAYFAPPSNPSNGRGLVFVGGLDWYPNRDAATYFLREVWPRVQRDDPNTTVSFIGRDPPPELTGHPDPRVRALGFVDDIRPIVEGAAVFICPMREGGGTRLKVLDALAMGKPLVSTAMGVEGINVIDDVHYLRADTPEAFAAAIGQVSKDTDLQRRLGANGRLLMEEHYSWNRIGQILDDAYQAITSPKTAR